jgi:hypothetical protein
MNVRKIAGFTALASLILMIALFALGIARIVRAPEPERGGEIGLIALAEARPVSEMILAEHQLAVLRELYARWAFRWVPAITYEAMEGVPVMVVTLRRPLFYSEAIDLDAWVRDGGRALLFAEPGQSWPAPADTVNADLVDSTWALRLAPRDDGPLVLPGGSSLMLHNAGRWRARGGCDVRADGFIAECRPGKGRVLLVADTGLLDRDVINPYSDEFSDTVGMVGQLIEALERDAPVPARFVRGEGGYARPKPPAMLFIAAGSLFWVALGALVVWVLLRNATAAGRPTAQGRARIVRNQPAFVEDNAAAAPE